METKKEKISNDKSNFADKQYSLKKILIICAVASITGGLLYWFGLPLLGKHIAFPGPAVAAKPFRWVAKNQKEQIWRTIH